jgi:hypothetical protein
MTPRVGMEDRLACTVEKHFEHRRRRSQILPYAMVAAQHEPQSHHHQGESE